MTDREKKYKRHVSLYMEIEGCKLEIKARSKVLHRQINKYNNYDNRTKALATKIHLMLHELETLEEEFKALQADIYTDIS